MKEHQNISIFPHQDSLISF